LVSIAHGSLLSIIACMLTNNMGNAEKDFFVPENNSLTVLDFFLNKKEGTGPDSGKEYVDVKLTAFNH